MTPATNLVRRIPWPAKATAGELDELLAREWIVTNGLGGYACGTVSGVITRRFHGLLIAALPSPYGRRMMLNHVMDSLRFPDGRCIQLGGEEHVGRAPVIYGAEYLAEFRLENGLPVWTYEAEGVTLEKRLVLPHRQNTVCLHYRILRAGAEVRLELRPAMHFRPHEGSLRLAQDEPYQVKVVGERYEFSTSSDLNLPPLRLMAYGDEAAFTFDRRYLDEFIYRTEESRGYESRGGLWSPGYFHVRLAEGGEGTLVASTESWEIMRALQPADAIRTEQTRLRRLIARAHPKAQDSLGAELVLAADQFVITPVGRVEDVARAHAAGDEVRTVIAGYHWFTDWGRDTMISLEGLTLTTGRHNEASWILRTFAYYIRDGLIPNMFPEGEASGLYHTADATMWFFHAIDRYLEHSEDRALLRMVLPKLVEIVRRHVEGTRFGIGVDPADGLLRQGAHGYQLTWMDAKVDDWVVTPRRGKAVEINALWYNALRLLGTWAAEEDVDTGDLDLAAMAERARQAFNRSFWSDELGHLYDVIDGESGDDPACRPNQLFAIAPRYPVLDESRWNAVVEVCKERLLTPMGLRSLAPGHPDYKAKYYGDLRSRDAAYHQGTVWAWLIGPFIDAWLKVHPEEKTRAREFLQGFGAHLEEGAVGSISEIFDAEAPYTQRGCVAQAWSVAEVLRCWVKTAV